MRIGTIFSGCGAPEQAAARVWPNHEIAFACEYDKFARQSYKAIYDIADEHFHTDVRQMDGTQYQGKVDVLVWGFPCTSYSIAGLRKGMDDEKTGDLFHQGLRILKQCKPKYTIIENVKGLLSIDGGKTIKLIMRDLREAGYFCHYEVINSKDYGIPQNRERIFIVGFLDHEAYYRFQFAPKQPLTKRLKDVLELSVDKKYYLSETAIKGFQAHAERMAERGNGFKFDPTDGDTVASSVATRAGGQPCDNFVKVIGKLDLQCKDYMKRVSDDEGISPCLLTMQGSGQEPKIEIRGSAQANAGVMYDCCTSLTSAMGMGGGQIPIVNRIRKLTPLECWRLQDFPDEAHEKAKVAGVSDSMRYKQSGNSMTVAVVEMIFRQIDKALKGCVDNTSLFGVVQ